MIGDVSNQRVREIATQAWRAIETLHREPVAAIAEAINRGLAEVGTAAQRVDTLPAAQRRVAARLARGPATATQMATEFGCTSQAVWLVARRLVARRVVVRDGTTYRLAVRRPIMLPAVNEDADRTQDVLALCTRLETVMADDLRRHLDLTMNAAYATLLRLHARGRLVRVSRGVYAATDTSAGHALADLQVSGAAQVG